MVRRLICEKPSDTGNEEPDGHSPMDPDGVNPKICRSCNHRETNNAYCEKRQEVQNGKHSEYYGKLHTRGFSLLISAKIFGRKTENPKPSWSCLT